ncbi:MAG: hypothetical protein AAB557_05315 [Patescibacteria group bacterium]
MYENEARAVGFSRAVMRYFDDHPNTCGILLQNVFVDSLDERNFDLLSQSTCADPEEAQAYGKESDRLLQRLHTTGDMVTIYVSGPVGAYDRIDGYFEQLEKIAVKEFEGITDTDNSSLPSDVMGRCKMEKVFYFPLRG